MWIELLLCQSFRSFLTAAKKVTTTELKYPNELRLVNQPRKIQSTGTGGCKEGQGGATRRWARCKFLNGILETALAWTLIIACKSPKDWSSMASPFALQPKIVDGGRYIEPPTLIRNYFDASTPSVISNMVEPYPLLRKQHAGHSVEHDDIDVSISPYRTHLNDLDTKQQRRHSLSWGNMDKMISENRHEEHALGRVDTDTSTSTAGTHSRPWGGMRKMMSGKGKKSKHNGDKKGKSRIIDIDLIPQTLEEESTESHTPADHPTIKILVQEPQIPFHLESPIRQSTDYLHVVQRSTSPYDADVDSIDDHPSNTTKSLADSKEL
jgi:hypothetical protein